jgi:HK97 family phage major capsid protein
MKTTDITKRWFRAFVADDESEMRAALAGTQSITYTQGAAGGYLVPNEFHSDLILGMAQVDPLLDENVVTLVQSNSFSLKPFSVPGWDLSGFAAEKITEANQESAQTVPTAVKKILNGFTYRAQLVASFELEQDDFQPVVDQFSKAMGIGFARGIGRDLILGDGTTGPQGLQNGATDSGVTTGAAGVMDATDIENIFFALNPVYRNALKCAWVMADSTYRMVRKAKDSSNRPLISVVDGQEILMGKRVVVSPSMVTSNPSIPVRGIIFGDLSHYVVRVSMPTLRRSIEAAGMVENGQAMYTGLQRADAKVVDPASNAIVYATLHA